MIILLSALIFAIGFVMGIITCQEIIGERRNNDVRRND